MSNARIIGSGSYLPERCLTNAELAKTVETSDEWITERTGIKRRHIAAKHETVHSMGTMAAKLALAKANVEASDIDLIIVATCTPERFLPSAACLVQQGLGIEKNIIAFDVSAACTGFIYALSIAEKFIKTESIQNALIIGSEVMSRVVDWQDRRTCVLFGDGAGAVVLQASDEPGIVSSHLHAQGKYGEMLYIMNPAVADLDGANKSTIQMRGNEVFKMAVRAMGDVVTETLEANNLSQDDIDWLVPHQANLRIILATAKKLSLPMDRVIVTVDEHANTSGASIPLALDVGLRDGRIKPGQTVLFEAIGGGLTWGSALVII